jgi:hypothetical protein
LEYIHSGEYIRALTYSFTTIFVCSMSVLLGLVLMKYCGHMKL